MKTKTILQGYCKAVATPAGAGKVGEAIRKTYLFNQHGGHSEPESRLAEDYCYRVPS